jgi:hypothetical protein
VSRHVHCPVCHGPYGKGSGFQMGDLASSVPHSRNRGWSLCRHCILAGYGYPYDIADELFEPGEEVDDTRADDGIGWLRCWWRRRFGFRR